MLEPELTEKVRKHMSTVFNELENACFIKISATLFYLFITSNKYKFGFVGPI